MDGVLVRGPDGAERTVAVDVVVFTGDFIPDNELARLARLTDGPRHQGPRLRRRRRARASPGIFAAGNLVHPAETADVAAQRATRGRAAPPRRGCATATVAPAGPATVRLRVADPLLWVVPNLAVPGRGRDRAACCVRTRLFLDRPRLDVTQGGPAPRLVPSAPHDPEPFPCPAVGLAAASCGPERTCGSRCHRPVSHPDCAGGREERHPEGCRSLADRRRQPGRADPRLRTSLPGSSPSGRRTRPRSGCPGP